MSKKIIIRMKIVIFPREGPKHIHILNKVLYKSVHCFYNTMMYTFHPDSMSFAFKMGNQIISEHATQELPDKI